MRTNLGLPETIPMCVIGDFNADLLASSCRNMGRQLVDQHLFQQQIKEHTFVAGSLLDHLYTKNVNVVHQVRNSFLSDHASITTVLSRL